MILENRLVVFGERLQELRKDHKLTQKSFAKELGISWRTVGAYENNRCFPDYVILIQICKFFNVSVDYLLGLIDEPLPIDRTQIFLPQNLSELSKEEIRDFIAFLKLRDTGLLKKNP